MERHIFYSACCSFILLITFIGINAQTISPLTFSEVMFTPAESNGEFVEIHNTSTTEKVDLSGYKFKYYTSANNNLVAVEGGTLLKPGCFAVIIQGNYDFSNGLYKTLIPAGTIILKTSGNSFGSSGMANTTSRDINLVNPVGEIIDTYTYSADNTAGYSDEKFELTKDNFAANWKNSTVLNGTPGKKNSVSPVDFDLAVSFAGIIPDFPTAEDSLIIKIAVKNIGKQAASNFVVELYNDIDNNLLGAPEEKLYERNYLNLSASDSIMIEKSFYVQLPGSYAFLAVVILEEDENILNNTATKMVNVSEKPAEFNDIVINEIMYAPSGDEPEWIEIFNSSVRSINLTGWKIGDKTSMVTISGSDLILKPDEYLIISDDVTITNYYSISSQMVVKALPSLSNSGDDIILRDNSNRTIDSLNYLPSWGGSGGKSLERYDAFDSSVDSSNWKTSLVQKGGTPGRVNSVTKKDYDGAVTNIFFNAAYPIVGDKVNIIAEFFNAGKKEISIELVLYEKNTNGENQLLEKSGKIELSSGVVQKYEFAYHIQEIFSKHTFEVVLELQDEENPTNNSAISSIMPGYKPADLLVNEIMYNPVNGEPEWIEVYNNAEYDIILEDWTITDVLTTPVKTKIINAVLSPQKFLVISKDTSIAYFHKDITSEILVNGFANLNNDADGVVIKDWRGATIDSVRYDKYWGGEYGKSIERISVAFPSNDKSNWSSSQDLELSTPGRINSVTQKDNDLVLTKISTIPEMPSFDEEIFLSATVHNKGLFEAKDFSVEFYFIEEDDTVFFCKSYAYNLKPLDSLTLCSTNKTKLLEVQTVLCRLVYDLDEEESNNVLTCVVRAGYEKNSALVSEIMYNPLDGEPEWIEIINFSNAPINLKNWSISDIISPTKKIITDKDIFLEVGEYAVLTPDTNTFAYFPPSKYFQVKFGSLGNTSDGVVIYDHRNLTIDSVMYNSKWGGEKGYSLERISYNISGNDSINWATSLSSDYATPGIKNSLSEIPECKNNALVLNEVMYDPEDGNSEFIEFYNTTNDSIQLGGLTLQIGNNKKIKLSPTHCISLPNTHIIIANDSSIINNYQFLDSKENIVLINNSISLSNSGAEIVLKDLKGNMIDSLYYLPGWHNKNILTTKNKSLERLNHNVKSNDVANWSTSVDKVGATPGRKNSVFTETKIAETKVNISPNPFSPDNDGFEDFSIINFNLASKISQVRIRVFNSSGRLVRTIINNSAAVSQNSIIFNGLDDNGNSLRMGIYILLIEAATEYGTTEIIKTPVVIARKLH